MTLFFSTLTPAASALASAPAVPKPSAAPAAPGPSAAPEAPVAPEADEPGSCAPLALAPFGDPGDAVAHGTLPVAGQTCFTVDAKAGPHLVMSAGRSEGVAAYVNGPDGRRLDCVSYYYDVGRCTFPTDGTYTLLVSSSDTSAARDFEFSVVPLNSARGCSDPVGAAWNAQPRQSKTTHTLQVNCQPFDGAVGERYASFASGAQYIHSWIANAAGSEVCPRFSDDNAGCKLSGEGPFRLLSYPSQRLGPVDYAVQLGSLSRPEGCPAVEPRAYGTAPSPAAGVRCRELKVPAGGLFFVAPVAMQWSYVYDRDGKELCRSGWCSFPAAGSYTLMVGDPNAVVDPSVAYATAFLDRTSTAGCVPVGEGVHVGELTSAGQFDCLQLPGAAGSRLAALVRRGPVSLGVDVQVLDAKGEAACTDRDLSLGSCALTGTAPFRALVSAGEETGTYAIALLRTDTQPAGCAPLRQGTFDDDDASTLTTGNGTFFGCLSIPADAHATSELIQLTPVTGNAYVTLSVLDASGALVCVRESYTGGWNICPLTPGVAHTVLLAGRDTPASYTLSRRDVTATARGCLAGPVTEVGGPSQTGRRVPLGTVRCHRVTATAATDRVRIDARDPKGAINIAVTNADGNAVCGYRNRACVVTGSTSYLTLLEVPARLQSADTYRLDAWRIGTADGPAAECPRAASAAYGHAPLTGVLTEQRTAVCAVLPTARLDRLNVTVQDTTGGNAQAGVALYDITYTDRCNRSTDGYTCSAPYEPATGPSPTVLVVSLPEASPTLSYRAETTCGSVICGDEDVSISSVSPGTAPSGTTVRMTLKGTALHAKDTIALLVNGTRRTATVTSVSEDWRTLTADLDLRGVREGTYTVSHIGYVGGERHPASLTVTAPVAHLTGTFVPVQPTRLMDSRSGLGVAKAKIGPAGTVTLQVAGRGGVPATGVTAVVLNVTATNPTAGTFVSVYPDGTTRTSASNLNVAARATAPNLVVVPVVNGKVSFYNHAGSVDLLADVSGYYTG
ncbi:Tat pathway signal protein [Streptomyces sp. NPDC046374]|uniref:Tat pathway signal protein n=1 Tax=Streptomyces sp. NPDC046374 TaxID=3154917 RepID=UPI0033CBC264